MIDAAFSRLYSVSWVGLGIVSLIVDIVSLSSSCAWYTNFRLPLKVHIIYVTRVEVATSHVCAQSAQIVQYLMERHFCSALYLHYHDVCFGQINKALMVLQEPGHTQTMKTVGRTNRIIPVPASHTNVRVSWPEQGSLN